VGGARALTTIRETLRTAAVAAEERSERAFNVYIYIYTVGTRSFRLIGNFLLERFPFIWAARRLNNVAAAATLVITHTRARDFSPRDPHRQFLALSPHGSATTSSVLPFLSLPYPPRSFFIAIYIYNTLI